MYRMFYVLAFMCINTVFASNSIFEQPYLSKQVDNFSKWGAEYKYNRFEEMVDRAKQGDTKSQVLLGNLLYFGNGVVRNKQSAIYWWNKAKNADGDYRQIKWAGEAYFNLAKHYFSLVELGKENNKAKAIEYLKKAAEKENVEAKISLFILNSNGSLENNQLGVVENATK